MTTTAARYNLTPEQLDAFGKEIDAIRQEAVDNLGQGDVDYLRTMIKVQRGLEIGGRGLLFAGFLPPAWLAGTAMLGISKILDNMEIGHNVMHGQYDWTGDPALAGRDFEWDTVCPADQWRHSHNELHHTWTNIVGKDKDVGYGILRMSEDQRWKPIHLANPAIAVVLGLLFQWGVMLHDLDIEGVLTGEVTRAEIAPKAKEMGRKAGRQVLKDYVLFPLLTGPSALSTLAANATANLVRNVWSFAIIFCGHFPLEVEQFTVEECEGESRAQWYVRQAMGSANIEGGEVFHVLSGNLSHQIEHHLFPDLPAARYAAIAPEVRAAAERNGIHYETGRLRRQLWSVARRICRLALP